MSQFTFTNPPRVSPATALQQALHDFNWTFDYEVREPVTGLDVESAAVMAEVRGRPDLAQALRVALAKMPK